MLRKPCIAIGLLVITALFMFSAVSFANELSEIQEAIKAKKAKWVAGKTSMMMLTPEERRMRLGLGHVKGIPEDEGIPYEETFTAVPATFDWRNVDGNGKSYVTPIRNQRSCGSCWAFAATAGLESYTLMTSNIPNANLDLGEQILISCYNTNGCSGGSPSGASYYIKTVGLPLESCFPYEAYDANDGANSVFCSEACANWQQSTYKIISYGSVSKSVTAIKDALVSYGPLVTTFSVYSDFYSYNGGIYSYVAGSYQGGHAVLIVGYDDVNECFIVKNSWGTGWGESGFFRIDYGELNSAVNFGAGTLTYYGSLAVACTTHAECDDGNVCTEDICVNAGSSEAYCSNEPSSASCDDGLFCTINDGCSGGSCIGESRVCSDGVDCTEDGCDEVNDQCVFTPQDSVCNDGLFCNGTERCDMTSGCLSTGDPCPAGTTCNETQHTCYSDAVCGNGTLEASEECDDGNKADGDCCSSNCTYEAGGSSCSDGQFCNGEETCDGHGACQAGTPVTCDDGISCTDDSCNELTDRCNRTPNNANCPDDGIYCNGNEVCDIVDGCSHTGNPCSPETICNEETNICDEVPVCGDRVCAGLPYEDCNNCPADCPGVTTGKPSNRWCCGNLTCEESEPTAICPVDCESPSVCGNGSCDWDENPCNCSEDCGSMALSEIGLCSDGKDNDCDSVADCADSDCSGESICTQCSTTREPCNTDADCCTGLSCHPVKKYCR